MKINVKIHEIREICKNPPVHTYENKIIPPFYEDFEKKMNLLNKFPSYYAKFEATVNILKNSGIYSICYNE